MLAIFGGNFWRGSLIMLLLLMTKAGKCCPFFWMKFLKFRIPVIWHNKREMLPIFLFGGSFKGNCCPISFRNPFFWCTFFGIDSIVNKFQKVPQAKQAAFPLFYLMSHLVNQSQEQVHGKGQHFPCFQQKHNQGAPPKLPPKRAAFQILCTPQKIRNIVEKPEIFLPTSWAAFPLFCMPNVYSWRPPPKIPPETWPAFPLLSTPK